MGLGENRPRHQSLPFFIQLANMGATFLSVIGGIGNEHTDCSTIASIRPWTAKLEENDRPIIHAAAANAQRVVDLFLGSRFREEKERPKTPGTPLSAAFPLPLR